MVVVGTVRAAAGASDASDGNLGPRDAGIYPNY